MPNNILKDFFYGNINPNEKQFDRNSEYGKAAAGLADEEEKLRSMLDQETATSLDKMICLQAAIAGMTALNIPINIYMLSTESRQVFYNDTVDFLIFDCLEHCLKTRTLKIST